MPHYSIGDDGRVIERPDLASATTTTANRVKREIGTQRARVARAAAAGNWIALAREAKKMSELAELAARLKAG